MKSILILLFFLYLNQSVESYATIQNLSGVPVKIYTDTVTTEEVNNLLVQIDTKYFEKVKMVRFSDNTHLCKGYFGIYVPPGLISICVMDIDVLQHELAHHQQYIHKDSYYNMTHHYGSFIYYYEEITKTKLRFYRIE